MNIVFSWISHYGYAALSVLLVFGIVGLPIPDETLLVFCGYLIWKGRLHAGLTFLAGFGGSACGISLSYFLGRSYGRKIISRYGAHIGITPARLARVHEWFDRIGARLLTVGYFVPGVRHVTALVAGMSELRYHTFAVFAYSGAAIWVSVFLALGYVVGESWQRVSAAVDRYALILTGAAILVAVIVWFVRRRQLQHRESSS